LTRNDDNNKSEPCNLIHESLPFLRTLAPHLPLYLHLAMTFSWA